MAFREAADFLKRAGALPEVPLSERELAEKRIEEMRTLGWKMANRIWNIHDQQPAWGIDKARAKIGCIGVIARYVQGPTLERFVKEIYQDIESLSPPKPYTIPYTANKGLERDQLRADLAFKLIEANRELPLFFDLENDSAIVQVLFWTQSIARSRTSDEAFELYQKSMEKFRDGTEIALDLKVARQGCPLIETHQGEAVYPGMPIDIGHIQRVVRMLVGSNKGAVSNERDKYIVDNTLDQLVNESHFSKPLIYVIARIVQRSSVAVLFDQEYRDLIEARLLGSPARRHMFVTALAEIGAFDQLVLLKASPYFKKFWKQAGLSQFYEPILIELAKREVAGIDPGFSSSASSPFREPISNGKTPTDMSYWLEEWDSDAREVIAKKGNALGELEKNDHLRVLSHAFTCMVLSVPVKHAAHYMERAESYAERSETVVQGDELPPWFSLALAYARPDALDLTRVNPEKIYGFDEKIVLETGLMLVRQSERKRRALLVAEAPKKA